jgi:hypothetical protein
VFLGKALHIGESVLICVVEGVRSRVLRGSLRLVYSIGGGKEGEGGREDDGLVKSSLDLVVCVRGGQHQWRLTRLTEAVIISRRFQEARPPGLRR